MITPHPPYPWEQKVTICIAAGCGTVDDPSAKQIILCTDWRASSSLGASETMLKQRPVGEGWMCLGAGVESEILALHSLLQAGIGSESEVDETNIVTIVGNALKARKLQKADEYTVSRYGISYNDFIDTGKVKFPEETFRRALLRIEAIDIECRLILAGFSEGFPFILDTDKNCRVAIREDFSAIGEGGYLAQASLIQREYMDSRDFYPALYCVYEAKKHAERVPSVGNYTLLRMLSSDGSMTEVTDEIMEALEEKFVELSPKKIPNDISFGNNFLEVSRD